VRSRKLAIDGEKTLQGTWVRAELQGVVLSAFEPRLDRTAYRRDTACREPSSWYTKRATSARCGTVTRGVLRRAEVEIHHEEASSGSRGWCRMSSGRPIGAIA
jgi:hypothetical protein